MLSHVHNYTPDEAHCESCGGHVYEILLHNTWHQTTAYIFRSWTGARRIDGENYNGPVYVLGTKEVHNG